MRFALAEVLKYCSPRIVTVEYGRDNDRLGAGIPLISSGSINGRAKGEIAGQIQKIRELYVR